jgi:hypothetical protein
MKTETYLDAPKPLSRKILVGLLLGGLVGGVAGFTVAEFLSDSITRWDDYVNVVMGTVLIGMALISVGVIILRPLSIPKGCGVLQVIVLALAGVMVLAPMYASQLASPEYVFGAVIVLLIAQTGANLMLWRLADEMLRRVMMETSTIAFWALQMALFVYAAAERLGLVETVTGWGMIGILMGVYLVSSSIAATRRGMT